MTVRWRRDKQLAMVNVSIKSKLTEDRGVGIVIVRHPMTLLVPLHLITALDDDPTAQLAVNGYVYAQTTVSSSPELERDELALIRLRGPRRGAFGPIRIPRREVRLRPGQKIAISAAANSANPVRLGAIVEVRERTHGTTVVTDIEVEHGDSGSALLVNRQLVAVCQGMVPNEHGGVAIAMPLSARTLEQLWKLRRRSFLRRGLPSIVALAVTCGLLALGVMTDTPRSIPSSAVSSDHGMAAPSSWREPITALPTLQRLFDPAVNEWESPPATAFARMSNTKIGNDAFPTLEWSTNSANPVDVSYDLDSPQGEGANGLALTLSASKAMDIRVWAIWEGAYCGEPFRRFEYADTLRVTPVATQFVLPYDSFTIDPVSRCPGPHLEPDWGRFVGLTIWPEADSGRLSFYRIELMDLSFPSAESPLPAVIYQPIDGFSDGSVPINWWYIPKLENGQMTFVNASPFQSSNGRTSVLYRYPEQSSLRTLVLQLHDTHRPVDFSTFDGIEFTAKADTDTQCLLEVGYLDPAIPAPPGDPIDWPGEAFAYPPESIRLSREPTTHRIPFNELTVEAWVMSQYLGASHVVTPATLVEVKFLPQDDVGSLEILGVRLYRFAERP